MKHTLYMIREYPKMLCFVLSCLLAYTLYWQGAFEPFVAGLNGHGYVSFFVGGLLFSFGFTSPFAVAIFVTAADHINPYYAALLAGAGSMLMDLGIFNVARLSFSEELLKLRSTKFVRRIHAAVHHKSVSQRMREYLLWSVAGFVIASPIPDEFAMALLGSITDLKSWRFAIISFCLNTVGILAIILGSRAMG